MCISKQRKQRDLATFPKSYAASKDQSWDSDPSKPVSYKPRREVCRGKERGGSREINLKASVHPFLCSWAPCPVYGPIPLPWNYLPSILAGHQEQRSEVLSSGMSSV